MLHLHYPSGQLYAAIADEKRTYYYEDGTLKTVEPYLNGKLHGKVLLYWKNGMLKRHILFQNGVRHGFDQMWNKAGKLLDEGRYEMGKPVETHRRFGKKGKLLEAIEYLDDKRFNLREWDDAGAIRLEALWKGLEYKERVWDRFQKIWVEKEGYWDGTKLVYL